MEYLYLGRTGLRISAIALGTQTFGWNIGLEESKALLSRYSEAGGNYFDTADSYNEGESERILGAWLREVGRRDDWVVGTKVFFPTGGGPNESGASRKHIMASVEESLRRLGTDYVDLLQIHCFDRRTPVEETLRTLDDLVRSGKVRYLGASNYTPSDLLRAVMVARQQHWEQFSTLQLEYSLLVRSPEWELIPLCRQEGLGMLAWSPLAGGWLTGKYRRDREIPPSSRAGRKDRWDDAEEQRGSEQAYEVIELLLEIAQQVGYTPAQVSLAWLRQRVEGVIPLIGARTLDQLNENLGCLHLVLDEEQMKRLDEASAVGLPYPYRFIERYTRN